MFEKIKHVLGKQKHVHTPTILQMEATECGAASLAMILAYYGKWVPLEDVREACGVNRDGSSAKNVIKAARSYGLEANGKMCSLKRLSRLPLPAIIHWEFNHFLVLEGLDEQYAYLDDPAMGHRKVPMEDFKTSFTGIAMTFAPSATFTKSGKEYSVVEVIAKKLLQEKLAFYFIMVLSLCLLVPKLATPVMSSIFMDDILSLKHGDWLKTIIWVIAGTAVTMLIMTWLRLWLLTKWQMKLTLSGSSSFFWHVLHLPMNFFQQRSPNEVANRVCMNQGVADVLTGNAATASFDMLLAVFYLFVLWLYNAKLTVVGVLCSGVNILGFLYVRKRLLEMSMQAQMEAGKEYGTAVNGLMMIESLKANGNEDDFFGRWAGYHTKVAAAQQRMGLFNLLLQFLPLVTTAVSSAMVMTLGGFSVMDGVMTAGIFMAFQSLLTSFNEPVNNLLNLGNMLQNTEMQLKRLDDVYNYPEDQLNFPKEEPKEFAKDRLVGTVAMEHIVFGYSKTSAPLFSDFNLHLQPGDWVALVGGSGSGKSTLAKLLNGTYKEWEGKLCFDDVERTQIPHAVICNSMSTVDQDIYLFEGTVEENITMFDTSIRHQDVIRAAQDACIYDVILGLEDGFSTKVLEAGANFSGGQRQRLEIARALATNPSILILDEATSALDPITELKVMENIRHRGCTCIVVAHRLSTIRDCDEIVVIDHGNVVERGRHNELMQLQGAYAKLVGDKPKGGEQHA